MNIFIGILIYLIIGLIVVYFNEPWFIGFDEGLYIGLKHSIDKYKDRTDGSYEFLEDHIGTLHKINLAVCYIKMTIFWEYLVFSNLKCMLECLLRW